LANRGCRRSCIGAQIRPRLAAVREVSCGRGFTRISSRPCTLPAASGRAAASIACRSRRFLTIDRFDLHELPTLWGVPTIEQFGGRTHGKFYLDRFKDEIARGQLEVIEGDSAAAILALPDEGVDLFYVYADHTYEAVRRDLAATLPKVKPDGWIIMNDYTPADIGCSNEPYGVIQATNEFMVAHGWQMVYFALAYVMYCDVGLRKI
jgi:hypothetical protein